MVNPSRRSQLREVLRAQAHDQRWTALIERHGTPLLVLDPDRVARYAPDAAALFVE